jgi:hypothetical protein
MNNKRLGWLLIGMAAVSGASCATQPYPATEGAPGVFMGLLHGFTIFFSYILSLFTDYRIYTFPNSGRWYDFGFLIGAFIACGGIGSLAASD